MAKRPLTQQEIDAIDEKTRATNHYTLLGVSVNAPRAQVDDGYRQFARDWHPDRFFSRDVGNLSLVIDENFIRATRAYNVLRDENQRTIYDGELRASGLMPEAPPPGTAPPPARPFPPPPGASSTGQTPPIPPPRASLPPDPEGYEVVMARAPRADTLPPVAATRAPAPRAAMSPALARLGAQLAEQLGRAARYYEAGKAEYDAGHFAKAESQLYLASRYDPKNATYQQLYVLAQKRARSLRAEQYVHQAEQAAEYGRSTDAIALLRKAVESDGPNGAAEFKLYQALVKEGDTDRSQLMGLLRKAVQKDPKNVSFRIALAEHYLGMEMAVNATREVQAALEAEPNNEQVKALLKKLRR